MIFKGTAFTALILQLLSPQYTEAKIKGGQGRSLSAPQPVDCTVVEIDFLHPAGGEEKTFYRCVPDGEDGSDYTIEGLPDNFFDDHPVFSGITSLSVSSAFLTKANQNSPNTMRIVPGAAISVYMKNNNNNRGGQGQGGASLRHKQRERELWTKEGTPTFLVVRVSDSTGDSPPQSASKLSNDVFGTFGDPANLAAQYEACSGGKLRFQPATGISSIQNGVLSITVSETLSGMDRYAAMDLAVQRTKAVVGATAYSQWDHIMYVLPQSVNFGGAAAFAYLGWYRSVYMGSYASILLVLMHETGHNLNMRHSGEGTANYGDGTGYMGAHDYRENGPYHCFNAAKSWYLGWYSSGHVAIDPTSSSWQGNLVGIDDYLYNSNYDEASQKVVAKIGSDLYMMYNRKKGVNREVVEYGDQVTIIEQAAEANTQSWIQGHLSDGQEQRFSSWDGASDLVIRVCERSTISTVDTARVLVYLDNGIDNLSCVTVPPTPEPTPSPTITAGPTPAPTTAAPTQGPTPAPTTLAPTPPPTTCQSEPNIAGTCSNNSDCCSGLICSGGNPSRRYCFVDGGSNPPPQQCSVQSCRDMPCCPGFQCNSKNSKCF